jgi:hypothetical protein
LKLLWLLHTELNPKSEAATPSEKIHGAGHQAPQRTYRSAYSLTCNAISPDGKTATSGVLRAIIFFFSCFPSFFSLQFSGASFIVF